MNKNKKNHVLLRTIGDYLKSHPVAMTIAAICILLNALGAIFAPISLSTVINLVMESFNGLGWEGVKDAFFNQLIILICAYLLSITGGVIYSQITAKYAQTYMHELRCRMFNHLQDLPISYFDRHDKGLIMSTFTNDIDTIRQLLAQSISTIAICSISFIASFFVMLSSSVLLTLIVIVGACFMVLNVKLTGSRSARNFMIQQKVIADEEGYIEEMMNGLKVVKSFTHEEESTKDCTKYCDDLRNVSTKANKFANILMPIMGNIGNILYILVAFVGTVLFALNIKDLTLTGIQTITIGVVVSFLPMVRQFTNNVAETSNQVNSVAMAIGGTTRVYELLDEQPEVDNGYVTLVMGKYDKDGNIVECGRKEHTLWAWKHPHTADGSITYTLLQGDIRMFNVDFGYVKDKIVLHDVSLYAKPGQKIAFVGATGAGKTTITNLINRFYDIADGKIRYDGININKIKKKDLRRSLGMVLQDTNLFSGTIMDNIRYGRLDATDEECIEAAKLANADSFISRLPQGYNTYIKGNGSSISQGQAQLLSIARAAVSQCPVLILDEATSSIDTRTEAIVLKGMENLMKGKTVFLIAHRLSTIKDAQAIMVLEHGRIIERGTHEQLIEQHGYYYQLYTGVFELE